jgi:hypothetical protein
MSEPFRVAVLASGSGSNFQAILDTVHQPLSRAGPVSGPSNGRLPPASLLSSCLIPRREGRRPRAVWGKPWPKPEPIS